MTEESNNRTEYTRCNICAGDNAETLYDKGGHTVVRCRSCGLVYVNPRVSRSRMSELYSKEYFAYNDYMDTSTGSVDEQEILRRVREVESSYLFQEVTRLCNPGKILEIGCAEGVFLKALQNRGWNTFGVEVSQWAARFAHDKLELNVVAGTLEEKQFPENFFDVVYMGDVVEHLYDPRSTLELVKKKLKAGGFFAANTPNIAGLSHRILGKKWRVISPERHLYYFSPATARKIVEAAGLEFVEAKTHAFELRSLKALFRAEAVGGNNIGKSEKGARSVQTTSHGVAWRLFRSTLNPILNASGMGDSMLIVARKA